MLAILIMVFLFSLLILGQELALFVLARLFGLQTPVFSVGVPFGPSWLLGQMWNTQFRLRVLPFGGHVSIPELDPTSAAMSSLPRPFRKIPLWQRVIVVLSGSGFYIVFAWLLLFASISVIGDVKQRVLVQGFSRDNPIAANAGLKPGDQICAIDSTPVHSPDDAVSYLRSHPATSLTVRVLRDNQQLDFSMSPNANGKVGMALVSEGTVNYQRVNLIDSFGLATQRLFALAASIFAPMGMWIINMLHPQSGQPPPHYHGILAVIKISADIVSQDPRQLFPLLSMVCVDLAILNLLPWRLLPQRLRKILRLRHWAR